MNSLKTIFLFGLLGLFLVFLGRMFGGSNGMYGMLAISLIMNLGMYFFSDRLAIRSAGAKKMSQKKYPGIYRAVEQLSKEAKIPMPKIYISEMSQPNAFATGRNPKNSAVVLTKGLIDNLTPKEVKGVIAHELAHIKNRDIFLATVAAVIASTVFAISDFIRFGSLFGSSDEDRNPLYDILIAILAPLVAIIIQMAISREREFKADATGANFSRDPEGLASALEKIENLAYRTETPDLNPAFASLYISNPFGGGEISGFIQKLFSTHPPTQERVEKLRKM